MTRTDDDDVMETAPILRELPSDLGMLLFTLRRMARLWADAIPEHRTGLFTPGSEEELRREVRRSHVPSELTAPLATLVTMLGCAPDHSPEPFSASSSLISRWAFDAGKPGTALAFAHLAYRLGPQRGAAAVEVLRIRLRTEGSEGIDGLVQLAVRLGRSEIPVTAAAAAHRMLGEHYLATGDLPRAEASFAESLRLARQLQDREGEARARRGLAQTGRVRVPREERELLSAANTAREPRDREQVIEAARQIAATASDPRVALRAERMLRALRSGASNDLRSFVGEPTPAEEDPR